MTLQVIGAGFGRTGTLSLKAALEQLLGGRCYHMAEVFEHPDHIAFWQAATRGEPVDWRGFFAGYHAAVDWPVCAFWRELAGVFPDAKILLSTRSPESWHRSVCNTILHPMTVELPPSAPPFAPGFQRMVRELVFEKTFDGRLRDAGHAIAVYEAHNAAVRRETPPERLIDYTLGAGWEPLCEALDVPVPDAPYPRTNTTEEYRERVGLPPA